MVIYKNNAEKYPTLQHMLTCSIYLLHIEIA